MPSITSSDRPLRILSLDGGGIKGYSSLIILRRIFRTLQNIQKLESAPKPCEIFDIIVGTSTGGLIAIMLGRLEMTIDEAIEEYEQLGKVVFGNPPTFGKIGKYFKALNGSPYYDIQILQKCVKGVLTKRNIDVNQPFIIRGGQTSCKVMVFVTSKLYSGVNTLTSYESSQETAHNYECTIWEAASATAAAPIFFDAVKFQSGIEFVDGGLKRNNPVEEALKEIRNEESLKDRKIGCLVSIGTGVHKILDVPSGGPGFLKAAVKILVNSQEIADRFEASPEGTKLRDANRYFRFNVAQGMERLKMDQYQETENMKSLTELYLGKSETGAMVGQCANTLNKIGRSSIWASLRQ